MLNWKNLRAVLTICVALGWWSVWFPELAFWADVYQVVQEEQTEDSEQMDHPLQAEGLVDTKASVQSEAGMADYETAEELYQELLSAKKSQIKLKSRFFEIAEEYLKKVRIRK